MRVCVCACVQGGVSGRGNNKYQMVSLFLHLPQTFLSAPSVSHMHFTHFNSSHSCSLTFTHISHVYFCLQLVAAHMMAIYSPSRRVKFIQLKCVCSWSLKKKPTNALMQCIMGRTLYSHSLTSAWIQCGHTQTCCTWFQLWLAYESSSPPSVALTGKVLWYRERAAGLRHLLCCRVAVYDTWT